MNSLPGWRSRLFECKSAQRLYLNPEGLQVASKLARVLVMNHLHAETPGVFKVERAVVDEHGVLGRTLGDVKGDAEDVLFGLAGVQITRAEESFEISAEFKGFDAVVIKLTGFVIDGSDGGKDRACLGIFPGLRKHEGGEVLAAEGARAVEESAIEILVDGNLSGIKGRKREVMALAELFPIETKGLCGSHAGLVIPAVGENDATDVPEQ